jgi:hypothetical protein
MVGLGATKSKVGHVKLVAAHPSTPLYNFFLYLVYSVSERRGGLPRQIPGAASGIDGTEVANWLIARKTRNNSPNTREHQSNHPNRKETGRLRCIVHYLPLMPPLSLRLFERERTVKCKDSPKYGKSRCRGGHRLKKTDSPPHHRV